MPCNLNTVCQMSVEYHRISEEDHYDSSERSSNDEKDEFVPADQLRRPKLYTKLLFFSSYALICVLSICVGLVIGSAVRPDRNIDGYLGKSFFSYLRTIILIQAQCPTESQPSFPLQHRSQMLTPSQALMINHRKSSKTSSGIKTTPSPRSQAQKASEPG
jgi:hypothetical protein